MRNYYQSLNTTYTYLVMGSAGFKAFILPSGCSEMDVGSEDTTT